MRNIDLSLELGKVQTGEIFVRFFLGDKLISEYFKKKSLLCFYWPIHC